MLSALAPETKRIDSATAAAMLGTSQRSTQDMALRGEIPGAAKFGDKWTFDLEKLRRFIEQKELETCQNAQHRPDVIGGARPSGVASRSAASSSAGRFGTTDPKVAKARRQAGKTRAIAEVFGDASLTFEEAFMAWDSQLTRAVGPKTATRYLVSLKQLAPWLEGRTLSAIDGRMIASIIRERQNAGVTNATIKRDLGALSSVMNYAILQEWTDENRCWRSLRSSRSAAIRSCCRVTRISRWCLSERAAWSGQ